MFQISILLFVTSCRFFAHYGMRALIVLYMVDMLKFSDAKAVIYNAVLVALFELGSVFGGMLSDRYLGFKRSLLLGGGLLTLGYGSLMVPNMLVVSFGLIIMGGNLFTSNLPAFIGRLTANDTGRGARMFTLMYTMQNIGALVSIPLLVLFKDAFGYTVAFGTAALVMGLAFIALLSLKFPKSEKSKESLWGPVLGFLAMPLSAILFMQSSDFATGGLLVLGIFLAGFFFKKIFNPELIRPEKRWAFVISLVAIVIFFSVEDQTLSSFILFAERVCDKQLFGVTIPSSLVIITNPLLIALLGPIIAKAKKRISLPFFLSGIAVFALSLFTKPSIAIVFIVVGVISVAELYVGPLVFESAAASAQEEKRGEVMGLVPIAFSLAFTMSGFLSKLIIAGDPLKLVTSFAVGFQIMSTMLLFTGCILVLLRKKGKTIIANH